jgi:hypothetical protein
VKRTWTNGLAWLTCALVAAVAVWQSAVQAGAGLHPVKLAGQWLWNVDSVVFAIVGALIIARQPRNTIGWLLLVFPIGLTVTAPLDSYYGPLLHQAQRVSGGLWWYAWFNTWAWWVIVGPVFLIAQLFPTGRPVSRAWRAGVIAVAAWFVIFVVVFATFAPVFEFEGRPPIPNPIGIGQLADLDSLSGVFVLGIAGLAIMSVAAIFVRYWRVGAVQREQIKWLVYALALFAVIFTVGGLSAVDETGPSWFDIALPLAILLVPLAIAVAILRYRLWDIDLLIRRTLVYSALSAVLALAYFGSILVLQNIFQALTGESRNALVTVLSTLLIAALFGPVRARVQQAIDRRFYRQKYDAARTLAAFGAQARDVVALEELSDQLVATVYQTMQPTQVVLWVRGSRHE